MVRNYFGMEILEMLGMKDNVTEINTMKIVLAIAILPCLIELGIYGK